MSVTLIEQFDSRDSSLEDNGFASNRLFHVKDGNGDPDYVIANLPDNIGANHPTLSLSTLKRANARPTGGFDPDTGNEVIEVTYEYGPNNRPPVNANDEIWEFDMNAQTKHINEVKNSGGTPLQWLYDKDNTSGVQGKIAAIGADQNGNVSGVDVYRPFGALRVTKYYAQATVNQAFRQAIYALQGKTNSDTFQDWAANEVLFLGANVRYNLTDAEAAVTYNFLFGEPESSVSFDVWKDGYTQGDSTTAITITTINPFEYIWAKMVTKQVPDSSGSPTNYVEETHPEFVCRAQVYESSAFSGLGLVGP